MPRLTRLLSHDFLPGVSDRVRRVVFTRLGCLLLAALVAALCGLAVHPRVFVLSGGLLVVVAAGVCWPWATLRGVRGEVGFDDRRAVEGEAVGARVTITNHLPWPAVGLTLHGGLSDATAVRLNGIPVRSRSVSRWRFIPPRRGVYPLAAPRLETGFPFGLWTAGRTTTTTSLIVWPRTVPVGPVPTGDGEETVEGNVARNKVGGTGDVLGVRPYRRGDSPRRIHWTQSARHDRLIVCELQSNARPVVLLVLDTDPAVHTLGPDGSREWGVRVVASLAKGWLEVGARVGAVWDGTVISPASGSHQITRILDGLARLADAGQRPLEEVLQSPAVRSICAAVRVAITTDVGLDRKPSRVNQNSIRWVVLTRNSFPGPVSSAPVKTCDEAPVRPRATAWIEIPGPYLVPHRLRYGWSEARHGS